MSAKVHNLFENLLSLEKKVMIYGYIRVSSDKQTVENQRFEINNFCTKQKLKIDGWLPLYLLSFCQCCGNNHM